MCLVRLIEVTFFFVLVCACVYTFCRRRKSQPVLERTAGCVFRNPGGCDSAGAIIDQLGLKGLSIGGVCVSELHANFLINKGNGKCSDMLTLISLIKERVMEERGVELSEEIRYVPYR